VLYSYLEKHHKYLINIPLIVYWLILFVLTTLPGNEAINIGVNDKIEHFGAYGLLTVILYLNLFFQDKYSLLKKYPATFSLLVASLYGMVDELHQIFVPGRTADIRDWLADFVGSVLAVLIIKFSLEKLKQIEAKKAL
jgi:VanZ family protein